MGKCSGSDWCQGGDFNTSAKIDFKDLLDLVNHWPWLWVAELQRDRSASASKSLALSLQLK